MSRLSFREFFSAACGDAMTPMPYQERLARAPNLPMLVNVPTGLGKTAAAVLAWLWRRRFNAGTAEKTPRRLVYCLPMRVLVEQTFKETVRWLCRLGLLAGHAEWNGELDAAELPTKNARLKKYEPAPETTAVTGWAAENRDLGKYPIAVHLLLGGEDRSDWALWPERDAILIGTQDMLLSRALNRGYAARRPRWPVEFGLLNNDCLWVFDEVQLMGPGLATGLQLEAFRESHINDRTYFGTESPCLSWYMSATASRRMLTSREWRNGDRDQRPADFVFDLSDAEKADRQGVLGQRRLATKQLECQPSWTLRDSESTQRILTRHQEMLSRCADSPLDIPRRTLIICNTVDRAKTVYATLASATGKNTATDLVLLHSRFRPQDRARQQDRLTGTLKAEAGQIVVATQVVEAGVDLSSAILWTEIAPLPSVVQRLGRLNRAGEFGHDGQNKFGWTPAAVLVGIPLPTPPAKPTKDETEKHERETTRAYLPYDRRECEGSQHALQHIADASPANLEMQIRGELDRTLRPPDFSLQRHELLDFFDTDSNLSLGYTDVSPFVRGVDPETDVYVLWREWQGDSPPFDFDVGRHEICQVPIWQVIGKNGLSTWHLGFVWQGRDRGWQRVNRDNLLPGATLLLPVQARGYDDSLGWTGNSNTNGQVTDLYEPIERPTDEDLLSGLVCGWQSIESHTSDVRTCSNTLLDELASVDEAVCVAIGEAIRWHDYGKAIDEWQDATRRVASNACLDWPSEIAPIGKFSFQESHLLKELTGAQLRQAVWQLKRSFSPGLRHEVASGLALRQYNRQNGHEPTLHELLAEYLVMSHHGHVRKTLRDELPRDAKRIQRGADEVRGIKEGTPVTGFSMDGNPLPATPALSITCRQMGRSADGSESWTQSVLRLLSHFGPFRLAYFEAIVRAADCRASAAPITNVVMATPQPAASLPIGVGGDHA